MSAEDNEKKIMAGTIAVNNRDIQGFIRLLEPGFKLHLIVKPEKLLPQGRVSGPEGFSAYLYMLYSAFSDIIFQQVSLHALGNIVHQEFLIIGRHTGRLFLPSGIQLPPTGFKIRLPIEVFHTFNDQGGFISSTGYANLLDVLKQFKN
jgi:predicted ester cyclase